MIGKLSKFETITTQSIIDYKDIITWSIMMTYYLDFETRTTQSIILIGI